MKAPRTWIVVADGGSARLFERHLSGEPLELLKNGELRREVRRSGEIDADRPGRSFDIGGEGRHAMEPRQNSSRSAERDFLRQVADRLDAAALKQQFDRLVVVAPPRALGELRGFLNNHVQQRITAEVAKDLTKVAPREIPEHLGDALFP